MRPTARFNLTLLAALSALSAFSLSANAAVTVTQAFDVGASAVGGQSAAAQTSFLSAVNGQVNVDFESAVTAFTITQGVTTTGGITSDSTCSAALCGFNTTSGGSNFLLLGGQNATVTLNFTTGISYFGAYFSGSQLAGSTITFNDGQSESISLSYGANTQGGLGFVGFSDPGKLITSITINTGNDIVALDDVTFGTTPAVPEPATWALMGLGLVGLALTKARHQAGKRL